MGFPKIAGTFFGGPIMTEIYCGLYWTANSSFLRDAADPIESCSE